MECRHAGFTDRQLREGGFEAIELKEELSMTCADLRAAGYEAAALRQVGFLATDLRTAEFTVKDISSCCRAGEMRRAGFDKDQLKPLGMWKHDGEWQFYNQYWSCCHSIDATSVYCVGLHDRGA